MNSEHANRIACACIRSRAGWSVLCAGRRSAAFCIGLTMLVLGGVPVAAHAQTILDASYDPAADALVVEVAYRGTGPDHAFRLDWEPCRPSPAGGHTAVARLIDMNGDDVAQRDYRVVQRFDLSALACRPAEVTLRLGPVSNRTVSVPERRK